MPSRPLSAACLLLFSATLLAADEPLVPPGDKEPILRLDPAGPTGYVTALAFSPDGHKLYAAGWDKVVRVWALDKQGQFRPEPTAYRIPVGPGLLGAINAIALSPDGDWLAAAGYGVFGGNSGYRDAGRMWRAASLTADMRRQIGTIYVFHTRRPQPVRLLQGHLGTVQSLAFAPAAAGKPPLLVSVARERDLDDRTRTRGRLRVWDVAAGKVVDDGEDLPDFGGARPPLSVWHTGKGVKQIRVAGTCDDDVLRVWDVDRPLDRVRSVAKVGKYLTLAHLTDADRLLAAGSGVGRTRLRLWDVPADGAPKVEQETPPPDRDPDAVPRTMALLASQADGKVDHAAVIVRLDGRGREYRLQVVELRPDAWGAARADIPLWRGTIKQPVAAAATRGGYLAVAGNDSQIIRVYRVRDLLNNRTEFQALQGAGAVVRYVEFVRKGKDTALLMNALPAPRPGSPARAPQKGDWILDVARRQLTDDLTGWQAAAPAGEWRAEPAVENKQPGLAIMQGGRRVRFLPLKGRQQVFDFAVLSPRLALKVPILALCTLDVDAGQPSLRLLRADTGAELRYCHGHEGVVYSVAFSPDGRLLASAGEDQTVCVWSLENLNQLVDRRGLIHGLTVRVRDKVLRVSQVAEDSPARGKVRPGDPVAGLVVKGQLKPFAKEQDYYDAIDVLTPGTEAVLRIGGQDVRLPVGQLIDESKPLVSLFVTRGAKAEDREWVGWSPVGPYEASDPKAERHLGWHVNTGEAAAPVRFASADQYRKKYYREGVVRSLLEKGTIPPPPPPPKPRMGLLIEEGGRWVPRDRAGQFFARRTPLTLKLAVLGRPLDTLQGLAWQLDGGPERPLDATKAQDQTWTETLALSRGVHTVRFLARSREAPFEEYVTELQVRYQPPAPVVQSPQAGRPLVVRAAEFDLEAAVQAGQDGEAVQVRVEHRGRDQAGEQVKTYPVEPRQGKVRLRVPLHRGYNRIEVIAQNAKALAGHEPHEQDRAAVEVTYVERAKPPDITLSKVEILDEDEDAEALEVMPLRPVVVSVPRIRVYGSVRAAENLTRAEWRVADADKSMALRRFEPGKAAKADIAEELRLRPGVQAIRFLARAESSDEAERVLLVDYRPPAPGVRIQEPQPDRVVYGDEETSRVRLVARVSQPADRRPFRARVLVNGTELPDEPAFDPQVQTLTANVPLRPRGNVLQVRVTNAWGGAAVSEPVQVKYVRPPRILRLENVTKGARAVIDLRARVESPLPLIREAMTVEVNGQEQPVAEIQTARVGESQVWVVDLKGVPLQAGRTENEVRFHVSNAEARCQEPKAVQIARPPAAPPRVELLTPPRDCNVNERPLDVRFRVRSATPVKQVQLVLDGRPAFTVNVPELQPDAAGVYEMVKDVNLTLTPGVNQLRVRVLNEDGLEAGPAVKVNYLPRLARVTVDRLEPREPGSKPLRSAAPADGTPTFDGELPHGRVRLYGRVRWGDEDEGRGRKGDRVRVFVNGFQQLPAVLTPDPERERESVFHADLLLNRQGANKIALAVREQDGGDRLEFAVGCKQPVQAKRLHLLVVGARDRDGAALERRLHHELQLRPKKGGLLESPAFGEIYQYSVLAGPDLGPENLTHQLARIAMRVKGLAYADDFSNDVVLLYYQGGEALDDAGHCFRAGRDAGAAGQAVSCAELAEFFALTPGAHLLLLDVDRLRPPAERPTRRVKDLVAEWREHFHDARDHVVLLRYVWLGPKAAPKDLRLIAALEASLPQATRLIEVIDRAQRFFDAKSPAFRDSLSFRTYAPAELWDLIVRGRAAEPR